MDLQEEFNKLDIQKSLAVGVGVAALYWFLFFDNGAALEAQIAQNQTQITRAQTSLDNVKKAIEDKARFQKEIEDITLNMKDFQKYFAAGVDANKLLSRVSSFAESHELVVDSAKAVVKAKEFPKYEETAVEFVVEGSFHNIMEFIASLTTMEKAIDFSEMEFISEVSGDFPLIKFKTTLVVYSSNGEEKSEEMNRGDGTNG